MSFIYLLIYVSPKSNIQNFKLNKKGKKIFHFLFSNKLPNSFPSKICITPPRFHFPPNLKNSNFKNFHCSSHGPYYYLPIYIIHWNFQISSSIYTIKQITSDKILHNFVAMTFSSSAKDPMSVTTKPNYLPTGEIHVIVGPMFAGKTTALLRRVKLESNDGRYQYSSC